MFTEEAINTLIDSIGFGDKVEADISVDTKRIKGTSGRLFSYFHKLITVDNLYYTLDNNENYNNTSFNDYLVQLVKDSVLGVLSRVIYQNPNFDKSCDYSTMILDNPGLFEDAIGYSVAIAGIEQMLTSKNRNLPTLNAELSYQTLKIELEGVKDSDGTVRAVGLHSKLNRSIYKASSSMFPKDRKIYSEPIW